MASFCSVSDLSFTYPQQLTPLFQGLSFTLPSGWTGVVGANGAGKSTLVRAIVADVGEGAASPNGCSKAQA